MARLNRKALLDGDIKPAVPVGSLKEGPVRVLQFGEGNFLRAFVDWMFSGLYEKGLFDGRIAVVQPIPQGMVDKLMEQDGLYTLLLRGVEDGQVVDRRSIVTAVADGVNPYVNWDKMLDYAAQPQVRYIVSNTTEAGIAYVPCAFPDACPDSFPAKVTALLYHRYKALGGQSGSGWVFMPCELIDRNGDNLKACVLHHIADWGLEDGFAAWVEKECIFCNTLVDRIVTGYPREEAADIQQQLGYEDGMLDTGEVFHLWVIEGPEGLEKELPFDKAGYHVVFTRDVTPYRDRKVRLLNGCHTMTVAAAMVMGVESVREATQDDDLGRLMRRGMMEEILPHVHLPQADKEAFALSVMERFANPYIHHLWQSISLNSISKWPVRVLPSLEDALKASTPSGLLAFSLAALLRMYKIEKTPDGFVGRRDDGTAFAVKEDEAHLQTLCALWQDYQKTGDVQALVASALADSTLWGKNLTALPGLTDTVAGALGSILSGGMRAALKGVL
nr:tagaturonate reductase [bacterium]